MLDPKIFRNFLITRRQFLLGGLKASLVSLLVLRLIYLQLFKYNQYLQRSKKNSTTKILITPIRGRIIDCKGVTLATNIQHWSLVLHKPTSKASRSSLEKVFELLKTSIKAQEEIRKKIRNIKMITLIDNLSWDQVILVEQNAFDLTHISIDFNLIRQYPHANCMSHLIGYAVLGYDKLYRLCLVGKSGIEKVYDDKLKGSFGLRKMTVNAYGKNIAELSFVPSTKGTNLNLSIDCHLQNKIHEVFKENTGSVIVYDLKKHQIITLVSTPSFLSNDFASKNISHDTWDKIQKDPKLPLINKAISSTVPPGSIFKLVTCIASLKNGIDPKKKFLCKGKGFLGAKFRCWKVDGHGWLNMEEALGVSCNHYMYHVAKIIGEQSIIAMAHFLGFKQKVGIDLPGEVQGFLPRPSFFKPSLDKILNLCIGQGEVTASAIQLSRLVSMIATKGQVLNYNLNLDSKSAPQKIDIDPSYFEVLHRGMWRSVNHSSGTGKAAKSSYVVAGKTGTSQVFSKMHLTDIPWHLKNHALFVGFGPFDDPCFSCTVVMEHGGSGGRDAAPIAKKVFDFLR